MRREGEGKEKEEGRKGNRRDGIGEGTKGKDRERKKIGNIRRKRKEGGKGKE